MKTIRHSSTATVPPPTYPVADIAATLSPNLAHLRRHGGGRPWRTSNYSVMQLLGAGTTGAVLLARQAPEAPRVAMKVMTPRGRPDEARRFLEEAAITHSLQHPNIIPIYDLGVNQHDQLFYTMKHAEGGALRNVLERLRARDPEAHERYRLRALLAIFLKVCDALAYAHHRQVLHLDLKPENIMLGEFGEVYVADWGLARRLCRGEGRDLSASRAYAAPPPRVADGSIGGTPAYMSPEQARGAEGSVDERSDVFALGAILYQLLTLDRPFAGIDARAVMANVLAGAVIPPVPRIWALRAAGGWHLPPDILPERLAMIALQALATDPAARPQSVTHLQREVESCI